MTSRTAVDRSLLEEQVADLYENAPCGYLSILEDGTIAKVNQTLIDWLGYERDQLLQGRRFQELLTTGGRIFFETHLSPLLRMQGFANEISLELVCQNEHRIPVLVTINQRKLGSGYPTINRITVFNSSDRKKYESELLLERKKAEAAAHAKSDFLSMMSHEIRTPMNAVIGIANLLERTDLTEQQREYTSMLKTSSENLLNLLNGILDLSKIEAGKVMIEMRVFSLRKLVHDAVHGLAGRAEEKGLVVSVEICREVPEWLVGDPVKIGQVLTNLVGNAIKFTAGGSVKVKVGHLGQSQTETSLRFEVADTGIGISPDRLSRIFEEFTQADYEIGMKYGGSGLGLAISNRLVEMLGGQIDVQSELAKGSVFSFDLVLLIGQEALYHESAIVPMEESGLLTGLRLLVAEDNKANIYILTKFLRDWGITFEAVSNGKDAVEKAQSTQFDAILMDLRMPIMNGYEATALIRASPDPSVKGLPIIAFSASTSVTGEDDSEVRVFDDIIGKPFRPAELFGKIAFHTKRSHLRPSVKAQSQGSSELPKAIFDLGTYHDIFKDDQPGFEEIVLLIVQSYEDALPEILRALDTANSANFEFQSHRIHNSVEMLSAVRIKEVLAQARASLQESTVSRGKAAQDVASGFRETIEGLMIAINRQIKS